MTLRYGRGRPRHAALAAACSFWVWGGRTPGQATVPGPTLGGAYGPGSFLVFGVVLEATRENKEASMDHTWCGFPPKQAQGLVGSCGALITTS